VRVTTHDGHARLGHAEFRTDDVDDSLILVTSRKDGDAELFAVLLERLELAARHRVAYRRRDWIGRHVVIGRRQCSFRSPHASTVQSQTFEGLGTRHFVHEVQIDIEQRRFTERLDGVFFPDLLEEGPAGWHLANSHDLEAKNSGGRFVFDLIAHGVSEQGAAQR